MKSRYSVILHAVVPGKSECRNSVHFLAASNSLGVSIFFSSMFKTLVARAYGNRPRTSHFYLPLHPFVAAARRRMIITLRGFDIYTYPIPCIFVVVLYGRFFRLLGLYFLRRGVLAKPYTFSRVMRGDWASRTFVIRYPWRVTILLSWDIRLNP